MNSILPFGISCHEWCAAALLLFLCAILFAKTLRQKRILAKHAALQSLSNSAAPLPPVSIVVYAKNSDSGQLLESIPRIMEQDYPDFEVIVVYTDMSGYAVNALAHLTCKYPSLRTTFAPDTACNVSLRKLSLMLGIKAAKHDIVLITAANCLPESRQWIAAMAKHFNDGCDIVIGHSFVAANTDRSFGHRYRSFDTTMESAGYLAAAIKGRAFRGNGNNLAFRKRLFFENKGFSSTLNLKYGDDDIFVEEIAARGKVAVALSPESFLAETWIDYPLQHQLDKARHYFTQRFLKSGIPRKEAFFSFLRYVYLMATLLAVAWSILLALSDPANYLKAAVFASWAAALYLTDTLSFITAYRRIAKILHKPKLLFTLPIFRFVRPIANYCHKARASKAGNYTWE